MRIEHECHYKLSSGEIVTAKKNSAGKFDLVNLHSEVVDTLDADSELHHASQLSIIEFQTASLKFQNEVQTKHLKDPPLKYKKKKDEDE